MHSSSCFTLKAKCKGCHRHSHKISIINVFLVLVIKPKIADFQSVRTGDKEEEEWNVNLVML